MFRRLSDKYNFLKVTGNDRPRNVRRGLALFFKLDKNRRNLCERTEVVTFGHSVE